jgi:hypothetical protein
MVPSARHRLLVAVGNPANFALHLLAYARCHPEDSYDLLMVGADDIGTEIIATIASRSGVRTLSLDEAGGVAYGSVVIHSYAERDGIADLLASLSFDEVWYYGDLFRNVFVFEPGVDLSRSTLIYFGWELTDPGQNARLAAPARDVRVVPLSEIRDLWRWVAEIADLGRSLPPPIGESDYLIVLRYWGVPPLYPTRRHDTLVHAIVDLGIPPGVTRLVLKSDWRSVLDPDEVIALVADRVEDGVEVVAWSEPESFAGRLGSLNVLDFHLFRGTWITGHMSGFDGTPNVVVAITQPDAEVHWPALDKLDDYFYRDEVIDDVRQVIGIQQGLIADFKAHGEGALQVVYDGSSFRAMLSDALPVRSVSDPVVVGALTRLASSVLLDVDPDLQEITLRVDGLRRDRIRFERMWRDERHAGDALAMRLVALQHAVATRDVDLAAMRSANAELERSARVHATEAAALGGLEGRRLELEDERDRLRAALDAAKTEARGLADAAASLATALDAITGSRSWRLTAPARRFGAALRGRRR